VPLSLFLQPEPITNDNLFSLPKSEPQPASISLSLFSEADASQSNSNVKQELNSVPAQIFDCRVFHAFHLPEVFAECLNKTNCCIIGLEPLNRTWREQQYAFSILQR